VSRLPSVSVLIAHQGEREPDEACRASIEALDYPGDLLLIEDLVIGPRGACASYNTAVRAAAGEFVAIVGSHSRVDRRWLLELVGVAERHRAAAVGSKVLDASGQRVEWAGGTLSFTGHAWPVTSERGEDPLLFTCNESSLFRRTTFLEIGGFDEEFFAHLEDVDLGWRLNLLGHSVVFAPEALTYRAVPVSGLAWSPSVRLRLVERNALAMIFKNYGKDALRHVFPAAVALSLLRGLIGSGIDRLGLDVSSRPPETVDVSPALVAHLMASEDFRGRLVELAAKRDFVQSRRLRSDAEVLDLFGAPLRLHDVAGPYEDVARTLLRDFHVGRIFGAPCAIPPIVPVPEPPRLVEYANRESPSRQPTVSIVILTALGPTHLRECLTSIRQQTYPADLIEVVVVDNGSAEDPASEVQSAYPRARVIRNPTNLGFAAGNNVGAAAATGDWLVFLNDDTRARPDWLDQLVGTAHRRNAAAVASCILDWSGTRVDFVDGAVNFQGKGFQLDYDAPIGSIVLAEKPLLFACGCAMLIDRPLFLAVGGFDEDAFAYYEDVELGWRLNVMGQPVWFAPQAVVHHKHHGTSGQWPEPPRRRLYERNSLRMLYRLLGEELLERVLPAALLLSADLALLSTPFSRTNDPARRPPEPRVLSSVKAAIRSRGVTRSTPIARAVKQFGLKGFAALARDLMAPRRDDAASRRRSAYAVERERAPVTPDARSEPFPIDAAAVLAGLYGFLSGLPDLSRRRSDIQRRRRTPDEDVLLRFGSHWLQRTPSPSQAEHDIVHGLVVEAFALALNAAERAEGSEAG
jgi:GT2 family glycosyltransferase